MRIVTAAQQEKTRRLIRLLQQQLADAQAAVLEQAGANGRLAARAETAQAELKSSYVELTDSHREMAEQINRLQGQVRMLQRDRDGLRSQLDHALYDDKQLALIAAGSVNADAA